uniref:Glutathione transferase n=1 Tax=Eptatretus burgeri TaxID=7764 RepID=A0A8C4X1Y1_EPTBU
MMLTLSWSAVCGGIHLQVKKLSKSIPIICVCVTERSMCCHGDDVIRSIIVDFLHFPGENLRSDFLKLTPFQQVPVLEDNGFILTESVAIAKYVVRWPNVPEHWYPQDTRTQARVDEFLSWQHMGFRPMCGLITVLEGILPAITGCPVPTKRIEAMVSHLEGSLCLFKNYFLAGKPFLCGQQPSLADIFAYSDIQQPESPLGSMFRLLRI